jgi:outer membrane protein assembly factor BamB
MVLKTKIALLLSALSILIVLPGCGAGVVTVLGLAADAVLDRQKEIERPDPASNPTPAIGANGVPVDVLLRWDAAAGAETYDLYIALSPDNLAYNGRYADNSADVTGLGCNKIYYWRVVSRSNFHATRVGPLWWFRTTLGLPAKVVYTSPADNAVEVPVDADIVWESACGAELYSVYFDTSAPPAFFANTTETTFAAGTLLENTQYYWRVDSLNSHGTVTGDIVTFRTAPEYLVAASNPSPSDGENGVLMPVTLSWIAAPNALEHSVYFGTSNPPPFLANTTNNTYDLSGLSEDMTYYWRIISYGAHADATGPVWTFRTAFGYPVAASNPSPADGENGVLMPVTLGWTAAPSALEHSVYFGTSSPPPFLANTTNNSFDLSGLSEDTTYYWRVISYGAYANATGPVWTFRTAFGYPVAASNPSPSDGENGVLMPVTLSWTAAPSTLLHSVYFGTSSPPPFLANTTNNSYDLSGLSEDTTYYWRIISYGAHADATGPVWTFRTAFGYPVAASNPSPANGENGVLMPVTLDWTAAPSALLHSVYFGTSNPPPFLANTTNNSYDLSGLSEDTTYYWRIISSGAYANATGPVWTFRTAFGYPVAASNPSPSDGENGVLMPVTLGWTAAPSALLHSVYFGTSSPPPFLANTTNNSYDLSGLSEDTTYYWRIISYGAHADATGPVWTFRTIIGLPDIVTGGSPLDGDNSVNPSATLSWSTSRWADYYIVYFGKAAPGAYYTKTTETSVTLAPLAVGTTYYWHVDAVNSIGLTAGSHWSFRTTPATPAVVEFPSPRNYATQVTTTTTLSWMASAGASSYRIYLDRVNATTLHAVVSGNSCPSGALDADATYFWRIDAVGETGVTDGNLWRFHTAPAAPAQVSGFIPADGTQSVEITQMLSWQTASGADSYRIYFGRENPPPFLDETAGLSINAGILKPLTTYYWRVCSAGAGGVTSGLAISFCTGTKPPSSVLFVDPVSGADNAALNVTLRWTPPAYAEWYDVYFGTSPVVQYNATVSTPSFTASGLLPGTSYYWRVDASNSKGTAEGGVLEFKTTSAPAVEQVSNPSPADFSYGVALSMTLAWDSACGADSYNVYFGSSSPPLFVLNSAAVSYLPGSPQYDTTYYWRVDAVGADGIVRGETWSFKTVPLAPAKASSPSPLNGAQNVPVSATLSWTQAARAERYGVYLGTSLPINHQSDVTENLYAPLALASGTTYYWRIDSSNLAGNSTGDLWIFKTAESPPAQVSGPSPANAASAASIAAVLSWSASARADSYAIYLGESADSLVFQLTQSGASFDPGTLEYLTSYFWRVDAIGPGGNTSGAVWSFTTEIGAPPKTANPSPALSGTDVPAIPQLAWTAERRTERSLVYFGTTAVPALAANTTGFYFEPGIIQHETTYYWRVDSVNSAGVTTGDTWYFKTGKQGAPWKNGVPSPSVGAGNVVSPVTLSWAAGTGAESYNVYIGVADPLPFYGSVNAATVSPAGLPANTLIRWRVDSVAGFIVTRGDTWTFRTAPSPPNAAAAPSPFNGETGVESSHMLSWGGAEGATTIKLYFGKTPPGDYQGKGAISSFNPGLLESGTTYYWCVDAYSAGGANAGEVWSFATLPAMPGFAPNVSPRPDAENAGISTTLEWAAAGGAASYDVYFGSSRASVSFVGGTSGTTWPLVSLSYNTEYYWRVDARNPAGVAEGDVWSFRTAAGLPAAAVNPSPSNGATGISVLQDLTWTAGARTDYAGVNFGTDNPPPPVCIVIGTAYDPGRLEYYTTYYWRVDSVNGAGTTAGTVWTFFTVPPGAPDKTAGPVPSDGAQNCALDVTLEWGNASGAVSYRVYFDSSFPPSFAAEIADNFFDVGILLADTTYYWRVDAKNPGSVTTGDSWSFHTRPEAPEKAASPVPLNNAVDVTLSPSLTWAPAARAAVYEIFFGTESPGASQGTQTGASFNPGTLAYYTTYYWRVDSINATGTTQGDVWAFRTVIAPPGMTGTPNPTNGQKNVAVNPMLMWSAAERASYYIVYFGTSAPGDNQGVAAGTSFAPGVLQNETTYYWRVDAVNQSGLTMGAAWYFVTIPSLPQKTSNPNPSLGAALVLLNASLSWDPAVRANSYDVYFGTVSPGAYMGSRTGTTFDPGALQYGATYYWRIDSIGVAGTTTGDAWYFTTIPAPPEKAAGPNPALGATLVLTNASLSWSAASGAQSYNVYFGTVSPGAYIGNRTGTTFDPGGMQNDTTYYWRIDTVNAGWTITGDVWNFRTIPAMPAKTSNPNPTLAATMAPINASLSWSAAERAESYDVYFGIVSPGAYMGGQNGTTFDPGTLQYGTTYYWRIDSIGVAGTTAGDVWYFITIPAPPEKAAGPNPSLGATLVLLNASLSWAASVHADSYDVYFGTVSPGAYMGNRAGTTFDPGGLSYYTTYYWRIDTVNAGWTTTGDIWYFRTLPPPPAKVSNPNPTLGETYVPINASLSWTASVYADSYDVYFGTVSPGAYMGNRAGTSFDPGGLEYCTTYYWRIDAVNSGWTTTGDVWYFKSEVNLPGNASNPAPADNSTAVSTNSILNWHRGNGASGQYLFLGTSNPPEYAAFLTDNTYDPGGLYFETTYYWRIIGTNEAGNSTGPVWSFATIEGGLDNSAWPCFGRSAFRTRLSSYAGSGDNSLLWMTVLDNDTGASVFSSPALGSDGRLYVGCANGYLYALDAANGSILWQYNAGGAIYSSPAISSDGTIYVGSDYSKLHAVRPDGSERWTFQTLGAIKSSPVIGRDGTIFFGSDDFYVYAVKPDGTEKWKYHTNDMVESSPALGNDGAILYVGSFDSYVYALWSSNGGFIWKRSIGGEVASTPAVSPNGMIYVGSRDFFLYALDASGSVKWTYETFDVVDTSPAVGPDNNVYFASADGFVYRVQPDGNAAWEYGTASKIYSSVALDNAGVVYFGGGDNCIHAIESGFDVWSYDVGTFVDGSPAIGPDGAIYVGADNGRVYAIRP